MSREWFMSEKLEKMAIRAYSPTLAAQVLGLHVNTVRALIRSGTIPSIKLGRKYLIGVSELEKWLAGNHPTSGES